MDAAEATVPWQPDHAVSPGELIAEHLGTRGWTEDELASKCGKDVGQIRGIIRNGEPLGAEMAKALERVFGLRAEIWSGIEADWRRSRGAERRSEL